MKKIYYNVLWKGFLSLMAMASIASCVDLEDDVPLPPSKHKELTQEQKDSIYADSITKLCNVQLIQQHAQGDGFHVIIMGDGFTQSDISSGKFANAVQEAKTAMFEQEPMKSLQGYVDIFSISVPSLHDGVDYTKRDTGLRTSLSSGNDSGVYGDSLTILNCACKALINQYNITQQAELENRIKKTLVITLLNTNIYKGVTLLAADESVTDRIPNGYSISYVPAYATVGGLNVFRYLIRHEGVGHGIAKLADEYSYNNGKTPSDDVVDKYKDLYQLGFYQNTTYSTSATTWNRAYNINSSSWIYPFTQNADYAAEDLHWYTGAYEYTTQFLRFGDYSIMNGTQKEGDPSYNANEDVFNVVSRAMIYKRIMRAASPSWTWNINTFFSFDAPGRKTVSSNMRGVKVMMKSEGTKLPELATPRIINLPAVKLAK